MPSSHWQTKKFGPPAGKRKNCVQARVDVGSVASPALMAPLSVTAFEGDIVPLLRDEAKDIEVALRMIDAVAFCSITRLLKPCYY